MPLETKISSAFWSADDIGALDSQQKLAVLWIMTNKETNNIGFLRVSRRQFEFDTKLLASSLEGAIKGLPHRYLLEETRGGLCLLNVEHIGEQFREHALMGKNNIVKHLCGLLSAVSEPFREALLERYPTLKEPFQFFRSQPTPLQAPSRGLQAPRAEQSRAEQSKEGVRGNHGATETHLPEAVDDGPAPAGLRHDLAERAIACLNKKSGASFLPTPAMRHDVATRLLEVGNDIAGVEQMIGRQCALWRENPRMQNNLKPSTLFGPKFHDYFGQRALPAHPNPEAPQARLAQLDRLIETSRANRESTYHSSEATPAEKTELKQWRAERSDLLKKAPPQKVGA